MLKTIIQSRVGIVAVLDQEIHPVLTLYKFNINNN